MKSQKSLCITIVEDTREGLPLTPYIKNYPVIREGLVCGDYGIKGFSDWNNPAFILERKSLDDLCGSLTQGRDRFMRCVEKMRAFQWRGLLIECDRSEIVRGAFRSIASPESILATLDALSVRAGLHIFFCHDQLGAAAQLEGLVRQFTRGVSRQYTLLLGEAAPDK